MFFGPSGRVHEPQNQLYLTLGPPNYFKQVKVITNAFSENIILGNIKMLKIENFGKDVCRIILNIRRLILGNLEYWIKIFRNT